MSQDFFILDSLRTSSWILRLARLSPSFETERFSATMTGQGSPFSLVPTCMILTAISSAALTGARGPLLILGLKTSRRLYLLFIASSLSLAPAARGGLSVVR